MSGRIEESVWKERRTWIAKQQQSGLPADMRKNFDALWGIVKGDFQKNNMQGD